jgi:mono/diheme cytochrome c family protein
MSTSSVTTLAITASVLLITAQLAAAQDKAQIERGIKVYASQKCATCHSIEGKGAKKGPLDGVGSKLTEDEIRDWIINAPAMTKKTNATRKPPMKNYAHLPKEDVEAMVAYMVSLKKS